MQATLDFCAGLRNEIEAVVADARRRAMLDLGVDAKLDADQTGELALHANKCGEDRSDTSTALIERVLGGATYAVFKEIEGDEVLGQQWAQGVRRQFGFLKRFPDEEGEYIERASEIARGLADDLLTRWAGLLTDAAERESLPHRIDMDPVIARVARVGVTLQLFEQFRFEAKGENSSSQEWPHPHSNCIRQIRETGRWEAQSRPSAFLEGRGYTSENDPLRRLP